MICMFDTEPFSLTVIYRYTGLSTAENRVRCVCILLLIWKCQSSDRVSKKDCGRMTVTFREFIIPVQSTELGAKRSHAYDKNKT